MKDETLLQSRENFISLCNKFWNWQELDEITAGEEEPRLEWNGQEFTHRVTQALWRMYQAAIQSGNSAHPVTVPDELIHHDKDPEVTKAYKIGFNACLAVVKSATVTVPAGYVLVPVEPTPEMMLHKSGCQHHAWNDPDCPMRETRRLVWSHMLASAPKSPGDQLTPAPEGRLQKAIFNACIVFLYGCGNGYKNHEGHFYDAETEHSFCIWEIAEQIGVVKETGNYKWSLCKEMEDDIEEVYRKYAMRIMEAAPKVKP